MSKTEIGYSVEPIKHRIDVKSTDVYKSRPNFVSFRRSQGSKRLGSKETDYLFTFSQEVNYIMAY